MSRQSANDYPTVEVVNVFQRRCWSVADKVRMVEEASQPGMNVSYVAASPEELDTWAERILDAATIDDVFNESRTA